MSTTPRRGKHPAEKRRQQARAALAGGPKTLPQIAALMGLSIRNARTYAKQVAGGITMRKPDCRDRWTPVYLLTPSDDLMD